MSLQRRWRLGGSGKQGELGKVGSPAPRSSTTRSTLRAPGSVSPASLVPLPFHAPEKPLAVFWGHSWGRSPTQTLLSLGLDSFLSASCIFPVSLSLSRSLSLTISPSPCLWALTLIVIFCAIISVTFVSCFLCSSIALRPCALTATVLSQLLTIQATFEEHTAHTSTVSSVRAHPGLPLFLALAGSPSFPASSLPPPLSSPCLEAGVSLHLASAGSSRPR